MVKEALYKKYADTPVFGVLPLSNFGGVEILDILGNEGKVIACFNFGTGRQQIRKHTVFYTTKGRPYIRKQGVRYYFDNTLRVYR